MSYNDSTVLSLKDLAQIALGHGGALMQPNIAVLYSIIQGILKKLNCEDEIVSISGAKSEELKTLLSKANHPLLPCNDNLKILTEKLKNIPSLEQKIEIMEKRLQKHLEKQCNMSKGVYVSQSLKEMHQNWPNLAKKKTVFKTECECKSVESSEESTSPALRVSEPILQKSRRFIHNSSDSSSSTKEKDSDDSSEVSCIRKSETFVFYSSDILSRSNETEGSSMSHQPTISEFFTNWEKNIEDISRSSDRPTERKTTPAEMRISFKNSASNVKAEVEGEVNGDDDGDGGGDGEKNDVSNTSSCDVPCENLLTIPSPEYELPRALLKSSHLTTKIKELALWPFERRLYIIGRKVEDLQRYIMKLMKNWNDEESKCQNLDSLVDHLADLAAKITSNEMTKMDTVYGMQEIFDEKVDKFAVLTLKKEIQDMFDKLEASIAQERSETEANRASAFVVQPTNASVMKKESSKEKEKLSCRCSICESNYLNEARLINRILRLTKDDLQIIKERLAQNEEKQIRITSNFAGMNSAL